VKNKNYHLLRNYLEQAKDLPYENGAPNVAGIAREAGLNDRGPLYKNPDCADLFEEYTKILPARRSTAQSNTKTSKKEKDLEQKTRSLEIKNAELYSENCELRRQLRKLEHIEKLFESGRGLL